MMTIGQILERVIHIVKRHGYETETYSNHLVVYGSEFKADITVIDDNIIIIETRGFPRDKIKIVKVKDLIMKSDDEISELLGI